MNGYTNIPEDPINGCLVLIAEDSKSRWAGSFARVIRVFKNGDDLLKVEVSVGEKDGTCVMAILGYNEVRIGNFTKP